MTLTPTASRLAMLGALACGSRSDVELRTTAAAESTAAGAAGQPSAVVDTNDPIPDEILPLGPNAFDEPPRERSPRPDPPPLPALPALPNTTPDFLAPGAPLVSTGVAGRCATSSPSVDAIIAALTEAALSEAREDRPFLRYVVATAHLHQECGSLLAVDAQRIAVSHLLNSMSAAPRVVRPRALDAEQLLLRIDLRDYEWNRAVAPEGQPYDDVWEAIVASAGQGVVWSGTDADALRAATGTDVPWLFALDFVHSATSHVDLYYEALALPATLDEVLSTWGEGLGDRFDERWALGGTSESLISRQERLVGRSLVDGVFDYEPRLWLALNKSPDSAHTTLFVDPLTPAADAFQALFALPNGLPAFYAASADGRRSSVAAFSFDTLQNDFVTRVPVSCASCHTSGVMAFTDQVRPLYQGVLSDDFPPDEVQAVLRAYPPPETLVALLVSDAADFVDAGAAAGLGRVSGNGFNDATFAQVSLLQQRDMLWEDVATELFLSPEELTTHIGELPPALRRIDPGGPSGIVERAQFNAVYAEALCGTTRESNNRPATCDDGDEP